MVLQLVWVLSACNSTGLGGHGLQIDGIEIVNRSSTDIESFLLSVPRDGVTVSMNKILKGRTSMNGVNPFPYHHNRVSVRWFQDGVKHTMDELTLREEVESLEPVIVVIELHDDGLVVAYAR